MSEKLWHSEALPKLYHVLEEYKKPDPMDLLQLFLPIFPDVKVRQFAIAVLKDKVSNDDLIDLLPQVCIVYQSMIGCGQKCSTCSI